MRKKVSDIYSKAFPKKSGEEYSTKELLVVVIGWTLFLVLIFLAMKYVLDTFHLK